jgi:hypothetical protein
MEYCSRMRIFETTRIEYYYENYHLKMARRGRNMWWGFEELKKLLVAFADHVYNFILYVYIVYKDKRSSSIEGINRMSENYETNANSVCLPWHEFSRPHCHVCADFVQHIGMSNSTTTPNSLPKATKVSDFNSKYLCLHESSEWNIQIVKVMWSWCPLHWASPCNLWKTKYILVLEFSDTLYMFPKKDTKTVIGFPPQEYIFIIVRSAKDHLCGLVVRVPGYRSRSLGSIPGTTRFSEK